MAIPDGPQVTYYGFVCCQVCVPTLFTDKEVEDFANNTNPTGISSKWKIRKQGHPNLRGSDERVDCLGREGYVHIMLDC